jgi:hypoxanthine phosphoribosyltransferase
MSSRPIHIDENRISIDQLVVPYNDRPFLKSILISDGLIKDRIRMVAKDVFSQYSGKTLYVVTVLQGASKFAEELISEIDTLNSTIEDDGVSIIKKSFRTSSYRNMESTGKVTADTSGLEYVKGNHILIVEDIIDTYKTMELIQGVFTPLKPASFSVAALLKKRVPGIAYMPDHTCFTIPEEFVVGHGLDFNEYFRALSHIAILNEEGQERFRQ